ncbi:MAG: DNA-binding protein [Chloroflexi bacterium]|nr:DNA-binding protein [Chloroflexota bacterium]
MATQRIAYSCMKCNNNSYTTDEFRATGGGFSRFFDVQNKKFTTVSCSLCGFTEIYRGDTGKWGNVADFFLGG